MLFTFEWILQILTYIFTVTILVVDGPLEVILHISLALVQCDVIAAWMITSDCKQRLILERDDWLEREQNDVCFIPAGFHHARTKGLFFQFFFKVKNRIQEDNMNSVFEVKIKCVS